MTTKYINTPHSSAMYHPRFQVIDLTLSPQTQDITFIINALMYKYGCEPVSVVEMPQTDRDRTAAHWCYTLLVKLRVPKEIDKDEILEIVNFKPEDYDPASVATWPTRQETWDEVMRTMPIYDPRKPQMTDIEEGILNGSIPTVSGRMVHRPLDDPYPLPRLGDSLKGLMPGSYNVELVDGKIELVKRAADDSLHGEGIEQGPSEPSHRHD